MGNISPQGIATGFLLKHKEDVMNAASSAVGSVSEKLCNCQPCKKAHCEDCEKCNTNHSNEFGTKNKRKSKRKRSKKKSKKQIKELKNPFDL